ncbi:MAG: cobalamin biosynthesis protein CobW [Magnetospiraceae bacterium]
MKVPATVITGFLGAGKTTLIRHLMQTANGKRIALVINEFGDVGVDGGIVEGCGIPACEEETGVANVIELANGCICCTVADDFQPTIETLLDRPNPPDHIVIETSGLALPKPLIKAFNWPDVRTRTTVDGVVAVIDAEAVAAGRFAEDPNAIAAQREADPNLDHENPLEEVFTDQLLCADMVLVNKADLLSENQLEALLDELRKQLRPGVKLLPVVHGAVDSATLLGLTAAAEDDLEARPSHHDGADDHDHDDFETFHLDLEEVADPAALETKLRQAVTDHDILRIKGFVAVKDKPMRHLIQGVGGRFERYYDRPWTAEEARQGRLVVIGLHGIDRDAVAKTVLAS